MERGPPTSLCPMEDSGKFDVIHLLVKLTITPLKWCLGYVIRVISYDIYKY